MADRVMKSTGDAKDALAPAVVEVAEAPHVDPEWAANMAFAAEKVTFVVNESTDEGADNPVICGNSGDPRQFWRGVEYTEERRFLESLLRAKIVRYTQELVVDPRTGIQQYVQKPHQAPRYDVRVVNDPHKLGHEWLKSVRLQA